jgi:hypothetical protein
MTLKLANDQWVQLYSELAEQIMANGPSGMSEYLIEVENDDGTFTEMFTEDGQDMFNHYCDVACAILEANGVESE